MKKDITETVIRNRYPKLFSQIQNPHVLECGAGWFEVIEQMCYNLQSLTDEEGHPQVEFYKVYEVFGKLQVDYENASEEQAELIEEYSEFLTNVCERCGTYGLTKFDENLKIVCSICLDPSILNNVTFNYA